MDVFDPQKRSEVMSRIRGKDTKPEMLVRKHLHAAGLRYRLHHPHLPGKPDLAFPSRKIAVFVHGCFWHGHEGCKRASLPATRPEFWRNKIANNKERDERNALALKGLGWSVVAVWTCDLSKERLNELVLLIRS